MTHLLATLRLTLADVVTLGLIWVFAWVAWQAVNLVGRRMVLAATTGEHLTPSREQRARTASLLLRGVGHLAIVLVAIAGTLGVFKVNLTPALVGTAILGLAVSIGGQGMVKDLIAGFFFLTEDQFGVGDIIDAGGKSGVVERMTLRLVMLRDIEGTLHIVPNGQITTVSNHTRGWARAVVDVAVAYDADVDMAIRVLRDEAMRFAADPAWRDRFDQAPEVVGVQQLGKDSVTIRVLLRTRPGMQWEVNREFLRRIKLRLDREGIEIPLPQHVVHLRESGAPVAARSGPRPVPEKAS